MNILVSWDMLDANDVELIRDRTGAAVLQAESKEQLGELISQADVIFGFVHPSFSPGRALPLLQIPMLGVERVVSVPRQPEMVLTSRSFLAETCLHVHNPLWGSVAQILQPLWRAKP